MSFRLKTIMGIAAIEAILLAILIFSGLRWLRDSNEEQLIQRGVTTARLFATTTKDAVLTTDLASLESFVREALNNPGVIYARVRDEDGRVLAAGGDESSLARPFAPDAYPSHARDGIFDSYADIREGAAHFGRVEVGLSVGAFHTLIQEARSGAIVIAALGMFLVGLFSLLLGSYLTRQLRELKDASNKIGREGPGFLIPVQGKDEVAQAIAAFNTMSSRLAESYAEQRRALEESHDLAARIKASEAQKAAMVEAALDAIITIDVDGRILEYNASAEQVFGYTKEEVMGHLLEELIIPDRHRAGHREGMARFRDSGVARILGKRIELPALNKNGTEVPMEVAITHLATGQGDFFTAFMRDISERKRSEEELLLAAHAFEAQEAIFVTDVDARILRVNRAFAEITGYTADDVIGQTPRVLKSGHHDGEFYRQMWGRLGADGHWDGEIENRRKDGEIFPEWLSITAVRNAEGQTTNYVAHFIDISDQKRNQAALEEARAKAEQASEAKSEFLANMSHEIRTPMNGVIGMTGLLLDTALDEEQREYVETIRSSGDALLTVINDILDYSKIEANKVELEVAGFDLRTTVEDVADILAQRAYEKHLEFTCLLPRDIPVRLRGDPGRLRQILMNLTANAIKFTEHGEVAIEIQRAEDLADPSRCTLLFRVIDTGIGIPDARRDCLFRSFSQVDATTTKRYGGTGLGLAISKRLTEMMGGSIGVDSVPGRGSTFWFSLPFQVDGTVKPIEDGSTLLAGKPVLVVDDNATNLRVLREYLGAFDCVVHLANNAEQAILRLKEAVIDQRPVEIVIVDMMMPDTDGLTLGKTILANGEFGAPKLIMLSSRNQVGDAAAVDRAGFAAFLAKPVKRRALQRTLLRLFEERTPMRKTSRTAAAASKSKASTAAGQSRPLRILVVEDNITNQKVALAMLNQLGYRADAVGNGQEALNALYTVPYDLVLMDVQMPDMDGLEATRLYRNHEVGTGEHKAIIAMTAFATVDDRHRCLAAGMDDFLTKPVQRKVLADTLARHLNATATDAEEEPAMPDIAGEPKRAFRMEDLLERLDNDGELAAEIAEVYLTESAKLQAEIAAAIERGDAAALRHHAHSIKGATGNIGDELLHDVAFQLETSGREGNLAHGAEVFAEFQRLLATTNAVLRRFLDRPTA